MGTDGDGGLKPPSPSTDLWYNLKKSVVFCTMGYENMRMRGEVLYVFEVYFRDRRGCFGAW